MDLEAPKQKSPDRTDSSEGFTKIRPDDGKFNFPFVPYDIQIDLMKVAQETFETGKFAILESPTGTGKSLSLICSSLTWLRSHQLKKKKSLEAEKSAISAEINALKKEEEESGDWLSVQTKQQDLGRKYGEIDKELERIVKFEQKAEARHHSRLHNNNLAHYTVFNEDSKRRNDRENIENIGENSIIGSQESHQNEDEVDIDKKIDQLQDDEQVKPKIYYASRTHSQLSQFINEVKRTSFADPNLGPTIKVVPIASRANLCVNPEVLKLKDTSAINERCMEMQKESNKEKRCPFAKPAQVCMLKEDILTSVSDIEDIVSRGRGTGSCAYYATRMAVAEAELVVLPYNNLLHQETREASSLNLTESIVIVDEAHNILETLSSIHSTSITGQQLLGSHTILSRYYIKYHNKMTPRNAEIIKSIVQCLTAILKFLNKPLQHLENYDCPKSVIIDEEDRQISQDDSSARKSTQHEVMVDVAKFIGAANIEQFNIFKIIDYFNRSQLARKLLGFYRQDSSIDLSLETAGLKTVDEKTDIGNIRSLDENPKSKKRKTSKGQKIIDTKQLASCKSEQTHLEFLLDSNQGLNNKEVLITSYPIYTLIEFLRSLTNLDQDGKILLDYHHGNIQQSTLKFILLNPYNHFKQISQDARSIVLAGGTMQPFNEFINLLFKPLGIAENRLTLFSCGHVVDRKQLYVASLTCGSTGKPIELNYKTRSSFDVIDEIGRSLVHIARMAPGGMVCFLPSYDYEQICFRRWTQIGVLRVIETKFKQVFREPKQTSHLKPILDEYRLTIEKGKVRGRGAILLCVVGGKMSEGINFNDDLGRCVVMIGLPYANIKSAELNQKMKFYDKTCKQPGQRSAGQQYYENLCIKGINQSIGRAIRHKNDYASIILLDKRYTTKASIHDGLPEWIRQSLVNHSTFGSMIGELQDFFKRNAPLQ